MHPIERLRYVARAGWGPPDVLAAEAAWASGRPGRSTRSPAVLPAVAACSTATPAAGPCGGWRLGSSPPGTPCKRPSDAPTPSRATRPSELLDEALVGRRAVRRGGVSDVVSGRRRRRACATPSARAAWWSTATSSGCSRRPGPSRCLSGWRRAWAVLPPRLVGRPDGTVRATRRTPGRASSSPRRRRARRRAHRSAAAAAGAGRHRLPRAARAAGPGVVIVDHRAADTGRRSTPGRTAR